MIRVRMFTMTALSALAMTAVPASAHNFVFVDVTDSDSATGPRVTAACKLEAPILKTDGIQFVISGSATSSNSNVTPAPLLTHVHCTLHTNYGSYGGPSGDLFGPVAVAVGTSDSVPFDRLGGIRVCAYGIGTFQGAVTKMSIPSPGCP